jgi:CarD family transcriptional regulator
MSKTGHDFSIGYHVVYPAHGVGRVQGIESQEVAGMKLELYVITFDHEKMTLRVPTGKARASGLRALAETGVVSKALTTLKGRARVKRTMWSRRAQEYEAKINSGDLISIAEVVRDLHRADNQPEQSYSERQLYESALDRMAREVAAIERIDRDAAIAMLNKSLVKAPAAAAA